jgi:hypothetical protein
MASPHQVGQLSSLSAIPLALLKGRVVCWASEAHSQSQVGFAIFFLMIDTMVEGSRSQNPPRAAEALGVSHKTLLTKIKDYGLSS